MKKKIWLAVVMLMFTYMICMLAVSCSSMESREGGENRIQLKETVMIGNKLFSIIEVDSVEYIVNKESIVPLTTPCE